MYGCGLYTDVYAMSPAIKYKIQVFSVFTLVTMLHDNRCYPPCWSTTKRKQTPRSLRVVGNVSVCGVNKVDLLKKKKTPRGLLFN